jgi:transcriptional regulator with XRE-family HTH domain
MRTVRKLEPKTKTTRRMGAPTKWVGVGTPRKALGLTQADIAERMGLAQSNVSKIESSDDSVQVSTLRAYAEAIGATLEVCFTIDGQRTRVL